MTVDCYPSSSHGGYTRLESKLMLVHQGGKEEMKEPPRSGDGKTV